MKRPLLAYALAVFILIPFLTAGNSIKDSGSNSSSNSSSKIDPYLMEKLNSSPDYEQIPIYITFADNMRLSDFNDLPYDMPKADRRRIVIERLQGYSQSMQQDVRQYLVGKVASRNAGYYEPLWINNTIRLSADAATIYELAENFVNISKLSYDYPYEPEELTDVNTRVPFNYNSVNSTVNPGVILMNADDCWALGNTGTGVLVGNADDGFHWRHPDVVNRMYQNLGEDANNNGKTVNYGSGTTSVFDPGDINGVDDDGNGKIDDFIGWDFTSNSYNITAAAHGTATLSTVVGDGTMGNQTGVAPGAKSIVMRNSSGASQQWAAFQYALLMGADVMTSSLSWKWNPNTGSPAPPDYSQFRTVCDMSLAGGMIHTNSTSNDGGSVNTTRPIPVNISTAGNVPAPWVHPDQLHVGGVSGTIGVGNVLVTNDIIYSTSPYGPSTWGNWSLWGTYPHSIDPNHRDYPYSRTAPIEVPDSMGLIKPDVSAPGQNSLAVYVSSGTGYGGLFGGTSSATPHTAGCIALMLSINPEMLPQDVAKVIMLTAVEKGDPGKDNRYGAGRIDALAATTSPKFTLEGINNGSNMLLNNTLAASDTARELVGFKISTNLNPQVGSLRSMLFGMVTNASGAQVTSFDLYYDADNSNVVSSGDVLIKSIPFSSGPLNFDELKFKFLNTERKIILCARTTASANSTHTVDIGLTDTSQVSAYYTTKPFGTNFPFGSVTGTGNTGQEISYNLHQNYPNPFNPTTLINYSIAKDGFVNVSVFDAVGRRVGVLVNGQKTAGNYSVEFDADFYGGLSSGVYYYRITSRDFTDIKKMILLK
jgi:hypothetical protein